MISQLQQAKLSPTQMHQSLATFIAKICTLSDKLGLDLTAYQADHLALRINHVELAKAAHQAWLEYGKEISRAQINGRPIIVIAFDTPLVAMDWSIECLELPYPAEGKLYPNQDWEHVEFVVPSTAQTADDYFADIKRAFPELEEALAQNPQVKVKLSSPKGEGERLNNPTVAFKHQGVCIKLHPHSLKAIVESEQG